MSAHDVAGIRRALLEEPMDLRTAEGVARDYVPGTSELLQRRSAHLMFAAEGAGKSTVALVLANAAAAHGERVLYLDRENDPALTRERHAGILKANGWTDPLPDERLAYRHWPEVALWPPQAYAEAIVGAGFTGVVYDSVREMLAQVDLDPDREFSTFLKHFVTPIVRAGGWLLLLDNIGHAEKERPKGDSAKLHGVPEGYRLRTAEPFSVERAGVVDVTCVRSRSGAVGRTWSMAVGAGTFEVPARRTAAAANDGLLQRIREMLDAEPGLSLRGVQDRCQGVGNHEVRDALAAGVSSGRIRIEVQGRRHAHYNVAATLRHTSQAQSEGDAAHDQAAVVPTVPDVDPDPATTGTGAGVEPNVAEGGEDPVGVPDSATYGDTAEQPREATSEDDHERGGAPATSATFEDWAPAPVTGSAYDPAGDWS
jgi:hypothetical protein